MLEGRYKKSVVEFFAGIGLMCAGLEKANLISVAIYE
jgi:hypothetical protein